MGKNKETDQINKIQIISAKDVVIMKPEDYIDRFREAYNKLFEFDSQNIMRTIVNDMEAKFRELKEHGRINKGTNDYEFLEEKLNENKVISRKNDRSLRDVQIFFMNYENSCDIYMVKARSDS